MNLEILSKNDLDTHMSGLREELKKIAALFSDRETDAAAPRWLPLAKLAAYFGMSRRHAARYVASAISEHALTAFRPTDCNGTEGHLLYHVEEFERYLRRRGDVSTLTEKEVPHEHP